MNMKSTLNPDKIAELKEIDEDGSCETLLKLMDLFYVSVPRKINQMEIYYQQKNFSELRKEAHSLRSSSLTMGAEILASIAHEIEYTANDLELEERLPKQLLHLTEEFEAVKKELKKYSTN